MQRTSKAYKAEQKQQLREESYMFVYLGIINREAQASAYAYGDFVDYSAPQTIFSDNTLLMDYATAEQNFLKVDGSMPLLPEDPQQYVYWQGAVTQDIRGVTTFWFDGYNSLNLRGLTIDFGEYYPTEFTVTNGTVTYTYTNDSPGEWTCDDVFDSTAYLTISPMSMVGGNQRLRIHKVLFGLGFSFDNKTLLGTQRKNTISHISAALPSKQFTFTVENVGRRFAQDDPHSFINYLEEQQEVQYDYGRRLPNGSMYLIPGGKMALKTWSSNDKQAKFTAVGTLDYQNSKYYKGQYYPNGRSYYDLAVDVLTDAGIENYEIDPYLQSISTTIPLPNDKHKNLLQLIANAARSVLYEDRDGSIKLKTSFEPDVTNMEAENVTSFSQPWLLLAQELDVDSIASGEYNWTRMDGSQQFCTDNPMNTPYLSEMGQSSSITIDFESQWTFYNLPLKFDKELPQVTITVTTVSPTEFTDTEYHLTELHDTSDEPVFVLNQEFYQVNRIVLTFEYDSPYTKRVHLKHLDLGDITDYTLTYDNMYAIPTAKSTDTVKHVLVHYYGLEEGTTVKQITSVDAVTGSNLVTWTKPCHSLALTGEDLTLTVIESGPYYVQFTSSGTGKVKIDGIEYIQSDTTYEHTVSEYGTDKELKNPLIDNRSMAVDQAEWLEMYFAADTEYTISYRGEPALDVDDQIFVESPYVDSNVMRIESETINTGVGMGKCQLKGRRTSYREKQQ